jgi:hypothetical protein
MKSLILLFSIFFTAAVFAQQQSSTTIDGHAITVRYSPGPASKKPVMAGFHTDTDLAFKGVRVPKGDYTVYVLTDGPQWHLAVSKATGAKAAVYDAKLDIGRVNLVMAKGSPAPECRFNLTKTAALAAKLEVALNDEVASASFYLDRGANDREW